MVVLIWVPVKLWTIQLMKSNCLENAFSSIAAEASQQNCRTTLRIKPSANPCCWKRYPKLLPPNLFNTWLVTSIFNNQTTNKTRCYYFRSSNGSNLPFESTLHITFRRPLLALKQFVCCSNHLEGLSSTKDSSGRIAEERLRRRSASTEGDLAERPPNLERKLRNRRELFRT